VKLFQAPVGWKDVSFLFGFGFFLNLIK